MFASMWLVETQSRKRWIYFSYELANSIYAFALPLIAIFSCDTWKHMFFEYAAPIILFITILRIAQKTYAFVKSRGHHQVHVQEQMFARREKIRTANGETMIFRQDQEGSMYFEQLHRAWNDRV